MTVGMERIIAQAMAFMVVGMSFAVNADVACTTCKDEGVVYNPCPVCRGTKYVWKCNASQTSSRYNTSRLSYYVDSAPSDAKGDLYCGYGSTYMPIHADCRGTRKRINCPNCAKGKSKRVSTGKVSAPCPVCHGGKPGAGGENEYYIIRDARYISDEDREYIFLHMDKDDNAPRSSYGRSRVFKKRMSATDLEDFKVIYTQAKVFSSLEEMKAFLRRSPTGTGSTSMVSRKPTVYIVKDVTQITANDRRIVFEDLGDGYSSYSSRNIVQRGFTEQDIEDFRLINPQCRVFETLSELKAFMRTAKVVDNEERNLAPVVRTTRRVVVPSTATPASSESGQQKTLTMEELDARIKADMEHEKEMIRRRLGE